MRARLGTVALVVEVHRRKREIGVRRPGVLDGGGHVDVRADRIDPIVGREDRRQLDARARAARAGRCRGTRDRASTPRSPRASRLRAYARTWRRSKGHGVKRSVTSDSTKRRRVAPPGVDAVVGAVMRHVELALVVVVQRRLRSRRERQRRRLVLREPETVRRREDEDALAPDAAHVRCSGCCAGASGSKSTVPRPTGIGSTMLRCPKYSPCPTSGVSQCTPSREVISARLSSGPW